MYPTIERSHESIETNDIDHQIKRLFNTRRTELDIQQQRDNLQSKIENASKRKEIEDQKIYNTINDNQKK